MSTAVAQFGLGPHLPVSVDACLEEDRAFFSAVWATAAIAALITLGISCRHFFQLKRKAVVTMLQGFYLRFVLLPPVFAVSAFIVLICPRSYVVSFMLQYQLEGLVVGSYGTVLFVLLVHESHATLAAKKADIGTMGQQVTAALATQGPKKHFGISPLGCCWRPCLPAHNLTTTQLLVLSKVVQQCMFVKFILGLLALWAGIVLPYATYMRVLLAVQWTGKASEIIAMYGCNVLFQASRCLLGKWGIGAKFASIRAILLVCILQERIIGWILNGTSNWQPALNCVAEPGNKLFLNRANFWHQYMLTLESMVFALLVWRAFPASQVMVLHETQLERIELALAGGVLVEEEAEVIGKADTEEVDLENAPASLHESV